MAWSDPGDFTAGQVLTAAQMDSIREAMFLGQATFTNEAARDAAIPATGISLQEGMRAYLTAPTVPAATGATSTQVPSGITTIYNGSVWVCTTEVGARSSVDGTRTVNSYATSLTSDATVMSVTLVTGTTALVGMSAAAYVGAGTTGRISISVSGATTLAANDDNGLTVQSTFESFPSSVFVLSGLTAGTNTFTLEYKQSSGTLTVVERRLWAKGIA